MNKYKKNAFTLIELLAVIAILAIVMIIAVPTVLNTIATAKKGAFKDDALAVIKAAEQKISSSMVEETGNVMPIKNGYKIIDIKDLDFENKNKLTGFVYIVNDNGEFKYFISLNNTEYSLCEVYKNKISISAITNSNTYNCTDLSFKDTTVNGDKLVAAVGSEPVIFNYEGTINNLNINKVIAGNRNNFIITNDGKLYVSGVNSNGQLGDGTSTSKPTLINIFLPGKVVELSSYYIHTIALLDNGEVYTWGDNRRGQLGNNTITNSNSPIKVVFDDPNIKIKKVYSSFWNSYAISTDNKVYAWGANNVGQSGVTGTQDKLKPVEIVIPNVNPIKDLFVGGEHVFAILENNQVYNWGYNSQGQLGTNTLVNISSPTLVNFVGINIDNVKQIVPGGYHTTILLNNGDVYSFGKNDLGQLGLNNTTNTSLPTKIPTLSNIQSILGIRSYSNMAVDNNNKVYGWGCNTNAELGDGTKTSRLSPVPITLPYSNIKEVLGVQYYTLIRMNDNTLYTSYGTTDNKFSKKIDLTGLGQ